jgi:hypothetical protein
LTDTPEKKEIENKMTVKKQCKSSNNTAKKNVTGTKNNNKLLKKGKPKPKPRSTKTHDEENVNSDSEDEGEWPCLVCCEPFSNSVSKEKWIQCIECNKWAHIACTALEKEQTLYICQNCDSDDD